MIPKLLFDLKATQPSISSKRHGGGIYGECVLKRIIERGYEVEVFYDSRLWLNPEIKELIANNGIISYDLASQSLQSIADTSNCDRIYTCVNNPDFRSLTYPLKFFTLHGLRELETPLDNYYFKYKNTFKERVKFLLKKLLYKYYRAKHINRIRNLINSGARFIVVSEHTAASVKAFFPEMINYNIPVFYSPSTLNYSFTPAEITTGKYFMIVSANRWEKNALRAIIALDNLFDTSLLTDYKVIITGTDSPSTFKYKLKNPDHFEFKGYVDDRELVQLYRNAYALIYPSLNEGFGYPPLEAMHYGVPVLASPFSSIPEVCGDAALYFNPLSIDEISTRIIQISNSKLHETYSIRGINRSKFIRERQAQDLDSMIDYLYN